MDPARATPGLPHRLCSLLLSAAVVAAALVAVPAPVHAAVARASIGGCSAELDTGVRDRLLARAPKPTVVLGAADLRRARELERTAGPTTTSTTGMQVRQQLRLSDGYLDDALPATPTSAQARASFDRILRLQVAMVLAEDGTSPALAPPSRTTPASTYAKRIRAEVAAFVAMPDWGSTVPLVTRQDSLLNTAEVAAAVALGYSAAAGTMTAAERSRTRSALVSKALVPVCSGWATGSWMTDSTHNWGVVVGAGTAMAALVVADSDVDVAAAALTQSLARTNRALRASNGDGGSAEGPSYAGLVQDYTTYLSASLEASFGATGPSLVAGVPAASRYLNAVTGPSGQLFSYADSNTGRLVPVLPLWNARHGGDPLGDWLAQRVLAESHPDPLLFLWSRPPTTSPDTSSPTGTTFPTSGITTLRSSWRQDATFIGVKAGSNTANHSHLDLGSVVVDMAGQRFVGDPGQDCYCLPGYFDPPARYDYWRVSTAGHSTVSSDGLRQQPQTASAPMSGISVSGSRRTVAVNMTAASRLRWAQRRVTLAGEDVVVNDSARAWRATTVRAAFQTQSSVRVAPGGRSATMTLAGKVVDVSLPSSSPGVIRVSAAPAAPARGISTAGWRVLYVDAPTRVVDGQHAATVTVVLSPR